MKIAQPPTIHPLRLDDLADGDPARLTAHAMYEATRFADADVSGADLSGVTFTECALVGLNAHETRFKAARFIETRIERMTAPAFDAARAAFRDAEIDQSRMGSMELYDSEIQSLAVSRSKLGFVNLRSARIKDARFTDCTIDELDLGDAELNRVAFVDCAVGTLQVGSARLRNVDVRGLDVATIGGVDGLRGATISSTQAVLMATVLAEHLGIAVDD
jgi:uncharacterized protein YjbI with pentapeptide repeats